MTRAGEGVRSAREATRARLTALRNRRAGDPAGVSRRPDPATAPLSPDQVGLWLVEHDVREVPAPEWSAAVADSNGPLSLFVHPTGVRGRSRNSSAGSPTRLLAEAGLVCPPADAGLLRRYLRALVRTGEPPVPGKRS